MSFKNLTTITHFFFVGFPELGKFNILLFILVVSTYTGTVFFDTIIIILVSTKTRLHSPMHFFLKNFLFSGTCIVTLIVPNMLRIIWLDGASISVTGCIAQIYLYLFIGSSECYLLAAMSYDRYLAICKPLHYNTIMDLRLQYLLVVLSCVVGCLLQLTTLLLVTGLKFCDHNVLNHYFCNPAPLIGLACSDTTALQIALSVTAFPAIVIPFSLVILSYVSISVVILRNPSLSGRKKAFSTCSTHLSVVGLFYGVLIINFLIPTRINSLIINKMISVVDLVLIPLFNPIIYSLRNQEMRAVMKACLQWCK